MSFKARLLIGIGAVLILTFVSIEYISYNAILEDARNELRSEAEKVYTMAMATRRIYHKQFLSSEIPLTEKTVGFLPAHAMNRISQDIANWDKSGFSFNNVSDRPRNPAQAADADELDAMEFFRQNPKKEVLFRPFTNNAGLPYYLYARPIWVEKYCLNCHGKKEDAPLAIQKLYDTAYDYRDGDLRGLLSIKLPASAIKTKAWSSFKSHLYFEFVTFLILFIFISFFIRRYVSQPLVNMTNAMETVASGDYQVRIESDTPGEFSLLADTFNKMTEKIVSSTAELQESDASLAEAQRIAHVGSWNLDLVNNSLKWSDEVYRITEIDPSEFGGNYELFIDAIHPEDRDFVDKAYTDSVKNKTRYDIVHRLLMKNNSIKYVNEICETLYDDNGNPIQSVGTIQDITESKLAELELAKHRNHLEDVVEERTGKLVAANKELEAFSYSVSHDLRSPLRAIDGFSHAIIEDCEEDLNEDGKEYLKRIRSASQRMAQLIDDILKLSRITRHEIHNEDVNLSELVREVSDDLKETESNRVVEFVIEPGIEVKGDPRLIRALMENLLGNAWKFTSKHDSSKIEFGVKRINDTNAYFVRDDGAGFDSAYGDKLFGAFQRLHTESEFEGTGIGLATSQRIIHRHGGRIWAEGEVEKGSIFYFTLSSGGEGND